MSTRKFHTQETIMPLTASRIRTFVSDSFDLARREVIAAAVLLVSFVSTQAIAQRSPEITNLGARHAVLHEGRVIYSLFESFAGEDLNGDGDRRDAVLHVRDLSGGFALNLKLASGRVLAAGNHVAFAVSESEQGKDLNGDGDIQDNVLHLHDMVAGETMNLRSSVFWIEDDVELSETHLVYVARENDEGRDLNGDGDTGDRVLLVRDLITGDTYTLDVAVDWQALSGGWLAFVVPEGEQGEDLNGDGDTEDAVLLVRDLATSETTNRTVATTDGWLHIFSDNWLVFSVAEEEDGRDFNEDNDTDDHILHVHNLSTGDTKNLRFSINPFISDFELSENRLVFWAGEFLEGQDLNGDGDTEDWVFLHVADLTTGVVTNLGLVPHVLGALPPAPHVATGVDLVFSGDVIALLVAEGGQGVDLNGDADIADSVLHVHDLATGQTTNLTQVGGSRGEGRDLFLAGEFLVFVVSEAFQEEDLNGDGTMWGEILHLYHLPTSETTNLGLESGFCGASCGYSHAGQWLTVPVWESGEDLDGDGDTFGRVFYLVDLGRPRDLEERFLRGDCNDDGTVDISDATTTLGILFLGEGRFSCGDACDSNDDGMVDTSDPITTLGALFLGDPQIPAPGIDECGVDPTEDPLACETAKSCPE